MAANFPTKTLSDAGDTFTSNGTTFVWDGTTWKRPTTGGVKGQTGQKGEKGEKGEKGQKGDTGQKGEKGEKGILGLEGEKGEKGQKGDQGEKGQKGDQGEKGVKGEIGPKGEVGDKGQKGEGDKGQKGEDNSSKGQKGEDNSTKGQKGEEGDKGQKGEDNSTKGQKGEDNSTKGEKGEDNSTKGQKGEIGQKGEKGQDNSTKGQKGATGADNSTKGQKGEVGEKGTVGSTTKGQKGDTGADNSTKGQKGEVGQKGAAGAANANADEIYMTKVSASNLHAVLLSDESATASSGYKAVNYDHELSYNPSTNLLTALKARIDNITSPTLTCDGHVHVESGRIRPSVGNAGDKGIYWATDPGGGSGDSAYIRYYVESGENCKLHMGVSNDADDEIQFNAGFVRIAAETRSNKIRPISNNAYDLGDSAYRYRNLYINDLQLSNEARKDTGGNDVDGTWGDYTIQEGEDDLFLINNRTGKKYKFLLKEVD